MFILRGKRLGFSIAEIREVMNMYKEPPGEEGQLRLLIRRINEKRVPVTQLAQHTTNGRILSFFVVGLLAKIVIIQKVLYFIQ